MRNLMSWATRNSYPQVYQSVQRAAEMLRAFEEGKVSGYDLLQPATPAELHEAALVFQYGAKKYAAWNWAKGMKWSVPIGCAKRHWMAVIRGEVTDAESGLLHMAHFWCNMIMLQHYSEYFTEGDDRPPAEVFNDGSK